MDNESEGLLGGKWLFVGGAGYIGAHLLREFRSAGAKCYVFDNFVTGIEARIPPEIEVFFGDALDSENLVKICNDQGITGVVHLAAFMQARESVRNPLKFWMNNLGAAMGLANALPKTAVEHVIFSSSCSVYGNTKGATTDHSLSPMSPYAYTKVASEQVLTQACVENTIRLTILRYFNVIGCGTFTEAHDHSAETLLAAASKSILSGEPPVIFGNDLPTPDGTAMRDYLDVRDLASAHRLVASSSALETRNVFNVSRGVPISVKTILNLLLHISESELKPTLKPAAEGDPVEVWATPSPELLEMGWSPKFEIESSIRDHWNAYVKSLA